MKRLLLVRHGESEANVVGSLDCSVPGPPLSPVGEKQAVALADSLAGCPDLRLLFASTMTRAQQTLAPLAARTGLPVHVRDGFREFDIGDLQPRSDPGAHRLLDEILRRWLVDGDLSATRPGGENGYEIVSRFRSALADVVTGYDEGTAIVAAHGGVIRLVVPQLSPQVSGPFTFVHRVPNTGVVEFDVEDGEFTCLSWVGIAPE
ncbi:MAG TPA: histidine phosphatase family protein [Mycobacteriales bacterium]|nr:histidine phosphatase family protein [Mycobacteriales bacterium]